jgi:hypothetical protein
LGAARSVRMPTAVERDIKGGKPVVAGETDGFDAQP